MTPPWNVRGRSAQLIERRRQAAYARPEAGDTLVEILISSVVIGITVTAILGAFVTTISASTEQRNLAGADAFLRTFVDTATYDISLSGTPVFVACTSTVPASYTAIATATNASSSTYSVAITGISAPPSGCSSSNPSPEQLSATVSAKGVSIDATTFVVYPPSNTVAAITTSVTSLSPNSGPASGGTTVTISGNGFTGATSVKFGSTAATSYSVVNSTTITAVSPAGTGTVDVTVTTTVGHPRPTRSISSPTRQPSLRSLPRADHGRRHDRHDHRHRVHRCERRELRGDSRDLLHRGRAASSITTVSPASSTATVDIAVTTIAGTSATSTADKFSYATIVSGISPNSVPPRGAGRESARQRLHRCHVGQVRVDGRDGVHRELGHFHHRHVAGRHGHRGCDRDHAFWYIRGQCQRSFHVQRGHCGRFGTCDPERVQEPRGLMCIGPGIECSSPNSNTCMMTSSSAATCDISGIWQGPNNTERHLLPGDRRCSGAPRQLQHDEPVEPERELCDTDEHRDPHEHLLHEPERGHRDLDQQQLDEHGHGHRWRLDLHDCGELVARLRRSPRTRTRDEAGATLVLALIFSAVIGVIVGSLAMASGNDILNIGNFKTSRASLSAAEGATQAQMSAMRYTYATTCPGTPYTLNGAASS